MLSRDEVKHIARLCRLKLTDEELEIFTRELGEILNYIEKLNKLAGVGSLTMAEIAV